MLTHAPFAVDMTSINMWAPIIKLASSKSDQIRTNALWILGTAIQNNPKAQSAVSAKCFSEARSDQPK